MLTPDSKASIERDLAQSRTAWETIVKYAFTANGTALGLSIGALSKLSGTVPMAQIGKAPLVIFMIGLLFAGLHLLFAYCLGLWSAQDAINIKLKEYLKEHDRIKSEVESNLLINIEFAKLSAQLQGMVLTMNAVKDQFPTVDLAQAKLAAEIMVMLSYVTFFFGTVLVIWRI